MLGVDDGERYTQTMYGGCAYPKGGDFMLQLDVIGSRLLVVCAVQHHWSVPPNKVSHAHPQLQVLLASAHPHESVWRLQLQYPANSAMSTLGKLVGANPIKESSSSPAITGDQNEVTYVSMNTQSSTTETLWRSSYKVGSHYTLL